MKKGFIVLLALLLLLSGCSCGSMLAAFGVIRGGDVDTAARNIQSCGDYTEAEIAAAMEAATDYFASGFAGCTLLDIRYDGDQSGKAEEEWAAQYGGEVMVLKSDFRSGEKTDGSLGPNQLYRNWKWIMVNTDKCGWEVKTCGYG